MVCEASDFVCHVLGFLSENELITAGFAELVAREAKGIDGIVGNVAGFVKEYSQAIVGMIVGSAGAWKWWHYREKILHQRLKEYLDDQDVRLDGARTDVLKAINRPTPGQQFLDPIFPVQELQIVLRERRWNTASDMFSLVAQSANTNLDAAIDKIERQITSAKKALSSHHDQLACAHILRGAIASASASVTSNTAESHFLNSQALNRFRIALQIPGFSHNLEAKEYEAHQLRKVGDFNLASDTYEELESRANSIKDERTMVLHIARCRRYQAEIRQTKAIELYLQGNAPTRGSQAANGLMRSQDNEPIGALVLRKNFAPYHGWDSIEQGEMLYFSAFVAKNLENGHVEQKQLGEAITEYENILARNPAKWSLSTDAIKRLRTAAKSGLKRVKAAQKGTYDTAWLLPPSLQ